MAELTNNINYMQPNAFKMIMDRKHFPNLTFFCNSIMHPSMSIAAAEVAYSRVNVRMGGDKLLFGELQCQVIMDEDMTAYQEMFNWIQAIVNEPMKTALDRSTETRPTTADITVSVLTNKNNVTKNIRYIDAVPTVLGDITFEATQGEGFITFPVSFTFSYFELID